MDGVCKIANTVAEDFTKMTKEFRE